LLFVWLFMLCGVLHAQPATTITLKVFDGKTGHPVMPTGYQVRVDHLQAIHIDWVKQNDDGTAELNLPADVHEFSIHLAYDNSMEIYVNCDAQKNAFGDVWYLADLPTAQRAPAGRRIVSRDAREALEKARIEAMLCHDPEPPRVGVIQLHIS